MKEEKTRTDHTGNNSPCITKTFTRGRRLERESDVGDLPSQFSDRVHHQGRPPEGTHLSPLLELCMDIISATDFIRRRMAWENSAWFTGQNVCVCVCVCGNDCCSVIQQSVAPRQLKTNVAVKWVVLLFVLLKAW